MVYKWEDKALAYKWGDQTNVPTVCGTRSFHLQVGIPDPIPRLILPWTMMTGRQAQRLTRVKPLAKPVEFATKYTT